MVFFLDRSLLRAPSFQDVFLGTFSGPLGGSLGPLGGSLGHLGDPLGSIWDHVGGFLVLFRVQVDSLGLFRGAFSAFLKVSVTHLSILADVALCVGSFFVF